METQTQSDPYLLTEISKIKAIDNHAPLKYVASGEKAYNEFDARPANPTPPLLVTHVEPSAFPGFLT